MTLLLEVLQAGTSDEGCEWYDALCVGGELIGGAVGGAVDGLWAESAETWMTGWQQLEMFFLSSWINMPLLVDLRAPSGAVAWMQRSLTSITFFFAFLGTLISVGYTFFKLGPERLQRLGLRLGILLLISTAGSTIIATLDALAHRASIGLLSMVGIDRQTSFITDVANLGVSAAIPFILGFIATLGVIIQWGIMFVRGALVPLLVGIWPMVAAASTLGSKPAEASFDKVTAWLLAFVIYPFPAALVYAAAFRLKSGGDGLGGLMYGFVLEMMAVFLLPALLRIIAPQTQILGKAFGGEIAVKMAAKATEVAVAVGAAVVTAGAAAGIVGAKMAGAGAAKAAGGAGQGAGAANAGNAIASPGGSTSAGAGDAGRTARGDAQTSAPSRGRGASTVDAGGASPSAPGASQTPPSQQGQGASRPQPSPTPQPEQPSHPTRGGARQQAATQAAQSAANSVNRATRDGLDDIDEIIGGK